MAFTTICPNCDAHLTAPDTVRGKKVKCKKCDEPFVARPTAEPEDDDRPAKPTRKRRVEDDEDEAPVRRPARGRRRDEDDDDPRPRARKKGGKKQDSSVLMTLLLIAGALVIAGGAVGTYFAFIKEDKPDTTGVAQNGGLPSPPAVMGKGAGPMPAAAGPITWVDYSAPDGTFTAKFPQKPVHTTPTVQTPNGPLPTDLYQADMPQVMALVVSAALPGVHIGDPIPQELIDQALEQACNAMVKQLQGAHEVSRKTVSQDGRPGREMVIAAPDGSGGTARVFIANARIWNLLFAFKHSKPDQAAISTFFDSFELK